MRLIQHKQICVLLTVHIIHFSLCSTPQTVSYTHLDVYKRQALKETNKKIEDGLKATKEDSQNLKADLNRMEESQKSTDQKMNKSIESME